MTRKEPEAVDASQFFEYGKVVLEDTDPVGRTASIRMQMPNCLFQAVTPSLLGAGFVDEFKVADPLAVWIPQVTTERLSFMGKQLDQADVRINTAIAHQMGVVAQTFAKVAQLLTNPADLIPMLPLGTYVSLRFRCRIDDVPKVLFGVQETAVVGVPEFQWALACVLAQALMESERWPHRPLIGPVPAL